MQISDLPLPDGWVWARLADIAEIEMGNSPPGSSYNVKGDGVPLINGPTEFGPGPLDHPTAVQFTDRPSKFCDEGDLLVCVRGSTTGRTNVASFRACIGRGVAAVRAYECQPYINHYVAFQTPQLLASGTGSTFPSITLFQLGALAVPLPPVEEQVQIVEAIEESLSDINAGVVSLKHAKKNLVELRAAILRAAISGSLTDSQNQESEQNNVDSIDGNPSVNQQLNNRKHVNSFKQGTLFSTNAIHDEELVGSEINFPEPLPKGWSWMMLSELCEVQPGRARNPSNRSEYYPTSYLRAANITEEGLQLADVLQMDFSPREREIYSLQRGDVILSEASGSAGQVGKAAIWGDELPVCCFQNTVIRLRTFGLESEYLLILMQYCYFNGVFAELSAGVGINHLGAKRLSQLIVPIAPQKEQLVIIESAKQQLSVVRSSQRAVDNNINQARQLREAVLRRAFHGELTKPSRPNDTALSILERIQVRRAETNKKSFSRLPKRNTNLMTFIPGRRQLLDVLREHPAGLTPEELRDATHYLDEEIDAFYAALLTIRDLVYEEKPIGKQALKWPLNAKVLLRLK